jgi:hypothetical protein
MSTRTAPLFAALALWLGPAPGCETTTSGSDAGAEADAETATGDGSDADSGADADAEVESPEGEDGDGGPRPPFRFNEMALTVLGNMVEHAVTAEGDWYFTETNDTVGLAPRALFSYGEALGRADLADLAVLTADRYQARATDILTRYLRGEDVGEEMGLVLGGAPSLVDAYAWTGDRAYRDFISVNLSLVNEMILGDPSLIGPGGEFSVYGTLFTGGAIAALDAEMALAIRRVDGDYDDAARNHLEQGARMLELLETYRTADGYYAVAPGGTIEAGENCNVLLALATMHVATGEAGWLERAEALVAALAVLWDDDRGAYRLQPGEDYLGLAENNVLVYARLLLHQETGDPAHLEPARRFFSFVEEALFRRLPEVIDGGGPPGHETEGGFEVLLHDNLGRFGEWYWCSGCNFFAIHAILLLNRLEGNADPVA